jgi:C-terminal processing protease CtpA/Prc
MKAKYILLLFFISVLLLFSCVNSNKDDSRFNLDFEKIESGVPIGWDTINYPSLFNFGNDHTFNLDSMDVQNGKYSASIEFTVDYPASAVLVYSLPENYDGKTITLSGYIKTKNVTDGYAGLIMGVMPFVAYNDTSIQISGTTDWKKYEMSIELHPTMTTKIIVGGYLSGKGKMWLDNLNVTIDGKEVQSLKPYQQKIFPAEKDKAFDTGSNIVFPELTEQKIDDLELLGQIWGFLKYRHPAITAGRYNWDYELFRILPAYLKANDHEQRDRLLLKWINRYGNIPIRKDASTTSDSAFIKPDLSWIDKSNLNQELKNLLQKIKSSEHPGYQYYVYLAAGIGSPLFMHENSYQGMSFPDAGFRLLALFRYWNMIQYFYPDKYLTDKDWNQILKEYIPSLIDAKNELAYELAITQLIGEICDTHAVLLEGGDKIDSDRGGFQVPVRVRFVENKLVVTDYYMDSSYSTAEKVKATGLKIGDVITHINGKPVEAIVDSIRKYYPASNESARLRDIAYDMLRSHFNRMNINYISLNQLKQKEISLDGRSGLFRHIYQKDTAKCYKFIGKDIGYITLKSIKEEDVPIIKKEFVKTKGIIIDIRNYPSAYVSYILGSYFVSKPTPFVKFTNGNAKNPGEFTFSPSEKIPESKEQYHGKLVVIVNEDTQSAAEFNAMAFQAGDNTTVIGSQTAGADGNTVEITLPGGLRTRISGIGIYYPDGRQTQRVGIVPDIEVKPTIKGIREGRDELLEKAIEIIKRDK